MCYGYQLQISSAKHLRKTQAVCGHKEITDVKNELTDEKCDA